MTGYKAFDKDCVNSYGTKFEEKKSYHIDGKLKFGNNGNGFHFCKRLEDTLRYFDGLNEEVNIALIEANNISEEYCDEYYGYYDMYVASDIYIEKFLSREEIIDYILSKHTYSVERFLMCYQLTEEELKIFKEKYTNCQRIIDTISYYQENNKETYKQKILNK